MSEDTSVKNMDSAVDYYLENSKLKSNGIREVPKGVFLDRLKKEHGIEEDHYKKLQEAINFETTAVARVTVADVEKKIAESSDEDLKNDDYRKGLKATTRLPTYGGSTQVTFHAEKWSNNPQKTEGEEGHVVVKHGSFTTKINAEARIDKDLHAEARDRIRQALNITD